MYNRFKAKEESKVKFEIVERTENKIEKVLKLDIANAFSESSTSINFILLEIAMMF